MPIPLHLLFSFFFLLLTHLDSFISPSSKSLKFFFSFRPIFFFNDNWFIWKLLLLLLLCMCVCVNSLIYDMQILSALPLIFSFYLNWIFFFSLQWPFDWQRNTSLFRSRKNTTKQKRNGHLFSYTYRIPIYVYNKSDISFIISFRDREKTLIQNTKLNFFVTLKNGGKSKQTTSSWKTSSSFDRLIPQLPNTLNILILHHNTSTPYKKLNVNVFDSNIFHVLYHTPYTHAASFLPPLNDFLKITWKNRTFFLVDKQLSRVIWK